jgi:beta-N-acetylhexosaminidase
MSGTGNGSRARARARARARVPAQARVRARARVRALAGLGATVVALGTLLATVASAANDAVRPERPASPTTLPQLTAQRFPQAPALRFPQAPASQSQQAAVIRRLTDRQLAGQRVIYSYSGLTPPARLLSLIRNGQAAGVIFFSGNISSRAQIASVARELEQANASRRNPVRLPLLLMTDQEGGQVRRLPGAPVLSEKQIGQSAHPAVQARIAGSSAASNLRSVGMNVNLAPVLDVFRTPGNFIDEFGRSYSSDPNKVTYLSADFIVEQQGRGVAATAKHFPGLGAAATNQNTDSAPVTLNLSARTIRRVDELPYKDAIFAGVKLIMVSWALYPSLDRADPAGLSSLIVQNELRQRLGYRGVTITDALEAGALRSFGTIGNRSRMAASAGMDLLLCAAQHAGEGVQALGALENAYRGRQLNRPAFRAAVSRILALRASLPG